MKKRKQFCSLLCGIAMMTAAISQPVMIASASPEIVLEEAAIQAGQEPAPTAVLGDNLTWTLRNNVLTISGTGKIPDYDAITSIPWYSSRAQVKSVVVEEGITGLGEKCFSQLMYATSISLPSTLKTIGAYAFNSCKVLPSITLPEGLLSIGDNAFYMCKALTSLTIPSTVKTVGTAITLSSGLTSFQVAQANPSFKSVDGVLFSKNGSILYEYPLAKPDITYIIPHGTKTIQKGAFTEFTNLKNVTIPSTVTSMLNTTNNVVPYFNTALDSVTFLGNIRIDANTFHGIGTIYAYPNVVINSSYASSYAGSNGYAFRELSGYGGACGDLASWELNNDGQLRIYGTGETISSGSDNAPWNSYKSLIESVVIEDGISDLMSYAFKNCTNLTSVSLPNSLNIIGNYAFYQCTGISDISLPESMTIICDYAFSGCPGIKTINLPQCETRSYAFQGCSNLTTATVKSAESGTFYGCSNLRSVTKSTGSINPVEYSGCSSLESFTIPENAVRIDSSAFSGCTTLTQLQIPSTVTGISANAFKNCTSLSTLRFNGNAPTIDDSAFTGVTATLHYPENNATWNTLTDKSFGGTLTWESYDNSNIIAAGKCGDSLTYKINDQGLLTISGTGAMYDYTSYRLAPWMDSYKEQITSVRLSEGMTSIGDYAFYGLSMDQITLPDSVTSIGEGAFSNSTLETVQLPNGLQEIKSSAFNSCHNLVNITIPDTVTSIGMLAFAYCDQLTDITIPSGVETIESSTFHNCRALTNVALSEGVKYIQNNAFSYCSSLKEITFPKTLVSLDYMSFSGILSFANFKGDVVSFEYGAFGTQSHDEDEDWTYNVKLCYPKGNTTWTSKVSSMTHFIWFASCGNHVWNEAEITPATCTKRGTKIIRCANCEVYTSETLSPLGHSYGPWISRVAPTCTSTGTLAHKECTLCHLFFDIYDEELSNITIPKIAHSYTVQQFNAIQHWMKCQNCDAVNSISNHAGGSATCIQKAVCDTCQQEYGTLSGHSIVTDDAVEPTCTESGKTEGSHCSVCNEILTSQETIPAKGHTFCEWSVTKAPTALENGVNTRSCTACDTKETETTNPLPGTIALNVKKIPLQKGKSTTAVKITQMTAGDKVISWTSSNKKIVKISKVTGTSAKLTGKKVGKAKITITLASGVRKSFTVKVQKQPVRTKKISNLSKKMTLKKGATIQLHPMLTPITSLEKITYKSSNTKIATVTKRGLIRGKKDGKTTITVKSGKKSYRVTLNVIL